MFFHPYLRASWVPVVARILLALVFVFSGFDKLQGFDASVGYIGALTNESVAPLLTILAVIFELGGGLMLLVNWKTDLAVAMLIVFLILATIIGHSTFTGDAARDSMQIAQIFKNLALLGGLLLMGRLASEPKKETAPIA